MEFVLSGTMMLEVLERRKGEKLRLLVFEDEGPLCRL
jgi:hypothetical protein